MGKKATEVCEKVQGHAPVKREDRNRERITTNAQERGKEKCPQGGGRTLYGDINF